MMIDECYVNVWDVIECELLEVVNMKLCFELMIVFKQYIVWFELSQVEVVKQLGVMQLCVFDLMCGKINLFGFDVFVNMVLVVGLCVDLQVCDFV